MLLAEMIVFMVVMLTIRLMAGTAMTPLAQETETIQSKVEQETIIYKVEMGTTFMCLTKETGLILL